PFSRPFVEKIRMAGAATATRIEVVTIHDPAELDAAFATLAKAAPDPVIVQPSLPTRRVAELAIKHRIPALSPARTFAEVGGLVSYAPEEADLYRRAAIIVDKVLKGARPADLPVEQPTTFELVINLGTARAIGLTIPARLLHRADEVIE